MDTDKRLELVEKQLKDSMERIRFLESYYDEIVSILWQQQEKEYASTIRKNPHEPHMPLIRMPLARPRGLRNL